VSGVVTLISQGLLVTLQLTAAGLLLAAFCGFGAGLMRVSRDPILRALARVYIEVFRGTSALIQLYWLYYVVPLLFDVHLSAMSAGIVVLGLNTGAYAAEVVSAALLAVPRAQDEAASALGLSLPQSVRHVLLPQALPVLMPPLSNLSVELLKSSALVSLVTLTDLTFAADLIRADTLRTGLVYGAVLSIYFILASGLTLAMRALERRVSAFRMPQESRP
jgi:polar amino acid transport system permease protein